MNRVSLLRRVSTPLVSVAKRASHDECYSPGPGWVGSNLPFRINNPQRLVAYACLFAASGFGLPFFTLRYMILKKNQ